MKIEEQKWKQKKEEWIRLFWVFLVGSIVGCIVETTVGIIFDHSFQLRKGLIYGPFIPVYGIGATMFYLMVRHVKSRSKVFVLSMILGGAIEYFCSYFQEKCFGTVSWDYSDMFLNIGGRTSLLYCFCWGILGVVFVTWILPKIKTIDSYLENKRFQCITAILVGFMVLNIGISCAAGMRQNERVRKIAPQSKMDFFLDRYYPDQRMDEVYFNKMNRTKPISAK